MFVLNFNNKTHWENTEKTHMMADCKWFSISTFTIAIPGPCTMVLHRDSNIYDNNTN